MIFPVKTFEALETPFYAYNLGLLRATLDDVRLRLRGRENFRVHYAVKANNDPVVMRQIARAGFGADCVSGREIAWAIENGFEAAKIVYSGVGKTDAEIKFAIEKGIGCFNVESVPELENIAAIAGSVRRVANVAIRINPDIDAYTHRQITTGTYEDQFGIPLILSHKAVETAHADSRLHLRGLHFHIGSQITRMEPYRLMAAQVNRIVVSWKDKGIDFEWINVGGGLGVDYDDPDNHPVADFEAYFSTFDAIELTPGQQLHFELGRAVVAQCGSLVSRVLYVKEGVGKKFAILDAGFTDLLRPALYGAHHKVQVLTGSNEPEESYDLVGPVCESTDCFARSERLPRLRRGSMVAFLSAGAYGQSMASGYNMRALPRSIYFE